VTYICNATGRKAISYIGQCVRIEDGRRGEERKEVSSRRASTGRVHTGSEVMDLGGF